MAKTRHAHFIEQTITRRVQFDPADLEKAAMIQKGLMDSARMLNGYVSATTRMTKAPVAAPDGLDIPAGMVRR